MVQAVIQPVHSSTTSDLVLRITDTSLLDRTVEEAIGLMMGVPVTVSETPVITSDIPVTLTAVIGLAGALSGAFSVVINESGAKQITSCMLGMEITSVDDTVLDGLGEITNILAGAWKLKIPELSSECLLSVPTVVTGSHYDVHRKSSAFRLSRSYRFNDSLFTIIICGQQP